MLYFFSEGLWHAVGAFSPKSVYIMCHRNDAGLVEPIITMHPTIFTEALLTDKSLRCEKCFPPEVPDAP